MSSFIQQAESLGTDRSITDLRSRFKTFKEIYADRRARQTVSNFSTLKRKETPLVQPFFKSVEPLKPRKVDLNF